MTWLQFFMWMAAIYLLYYAINILIDSMGSRASPKSKDLASQQLTFSEDVKPQMMDETIEENYLNEEIEFSEKVEEADYSESPIETSGGVSLKNLFDLARTEAIEFTKPVTF
ncbi:hypothetical protein FA048_12685 [Pedobacter polaris]|uniref:Uncharacterized protein n=1 Tax=Pedobacter polaris TaxID=2571273 RepID=A0A4U1CK50_9SPHI|nr:hypothetical protein [Pedobacter polaris]TKC08014.1 hypothetical protein FA048_12685 [Pedobacter polaris]